ncbi:glycosyltransferase family 25 protein [Paraferrimonas sedimenticola]|uniref:Glycosyl transferase n=1 Tax=Paraferrimonas sedimenticola TaxID=375674 RepID=A0AA37RVS2_9GAMM|nr:glycosyltransferase family 25 protein [Paraferrimonas sedimenticola]GLP95587.1 glycosyl transferase [Paraferrimonas sedimenticola]
MGQSCHILLINMDRSSERLEQCQRKFAAAGLEFERVAGIDGSHLSESEVAQYTSPNLSAQQYHRELSRGEIGCYLSHRKAWQTIVDRQLPYALVLEDDFEVIGNVDKAFEAIEKLDASEQSWDCIKLATYRHRERKVLYRQPLENMELVTFAKVPAGTCAQVVSLEGAKQLLKHSAHFARPVDTDLQHWWERGVEIMGLHPFVFHAEDDVVSEIDTVSQRAKPKRHRLRRLAQQVGAWYKGFIETRKLVIRQQQLQR